MRRLAPLCLEFEGEAVVQTFAIIGAGQAGGQAAQTLRQAGYDGRIVLIGDEPHPPYQRPPLSKKYLAGEIGSERLALLPEAFYTDNAIECRFGVCVETLDAGGKALTLGTGERLAFDRALIATGSRARPLPIPGADLEGVFPLRAIADVDRVRPFVARGARLTIIGAGYIGLEVAAIARGIGLDVTVIETAPRIMARTAPAIVSQYFENLHRAHGVHFQLGTTVQSIAAGGATRLEVETDHGVHEADCLLFGIGGMANQELAAQAGIAVANGVVVDEFCRTSAPDIFAAGDCASFPSARYGRRLRLESVQNAIDQAKAAALSMIGQGAPYDPVPWFWSDQYDVKLQIAGLGQDADEHVVRGDVASGTFSVAHLQKGHLIALDAINSPREYMSARRLVPTAAPIDRARIEDASQPLASVVAG